MASNLVEYSVSELSFALKRTLENTYGLVRVRGELSGFKRAASGHLYFGIKDEKAVIDGVCWRGTANKMAFKPEDGIEVICTGKVTTYPGRSRYQIVVEHMEPAGVGALMALFEERKKKLAAEGLFDDGRKRPLPYLPEHIALVTSPTGAVIRDILHRLAERFPRHVMLWPVLVQGDNASDQITQAINGFDRLAGEGRIPKPDVMIVARGGGSIEDLWSFNEENVARAVAECSIPIISAVGHETDTTLIDFVSDQRAPTPTAAAEIVVPVRSDLLLRVQSAAERVHQASHRLLRENQQRVDGLGRGLGDPTQLYALAQQRLDDLGERLRLRPPAEILKEKTERLQTRGQRLDELLQDTIRNQARRLEETHRRLTTDAIVNHVDVGEVNLKRESSRLDGAITSSLNEREQKISSQTKLLESLGHKSVLSRGYAVIRGHAGGLVRTIEQAHRESQLEVEFQDGRLPVRRAAERKRIDQKPASEKQERLL